MALVCLVRNGAIVIFMCTVQASSCVTSVICGTGIVNLWALLCVLRSRIREIS